MSEIIPVYLPHQTIQYMEDQLKYVISDRDSYVRKTQALLKEITQLKEQIILLKRDKYELLQSCPLEKKIEYMLKDWENSEVISSIENDRKAFSVRLAKLAREELQ